MICHWVNNAYRCLCVFFLVICSFCFPIGYILLFNPDCFFTLENDYAPRFRSVATQRGNESMTINQTADAHANTHGHTHTLSYPACPPKINWAQLLRKGHTIVSCCCWNGGVNQTLGGYALTKSTAISI